MIQALSQSIWLVFTVHFFHQATSYSLDNIQLSYFGTKTLYSVSKAFDKRADISSLISRIPDYQDFTPVQINGVIRHGTRNPGIKDLTHFRGFLRRLEKYVEQNGKHTSEAINILYDNRQHWLSNETFPNAMLNDKELVPVGYQELLTLGRNMKTFLSGAYNADDILLITSEKQRCVKSLEAFRDGLGISNDTSGDFYIDNHLLRFYDYCDLYLKSVSENETSQMERHIFNQGPEIDSVIKKLQRSFQPNESVDFLPISYKELKSIYTIAACEIAVYGTSSLAKLFDQRDMLILEYAGDLRSYWKRSYGHWINYAQACGLLKHIVDTMKDAVYEKSGAKKGIFRFGHAETLLPVMSLLELYKDSIPLNSTNFHLHQERLFRTSRIMPFTGNTLFVLYKRKNVQSERSEKFKVVLFHNEKPVFMQPCSYNVMCSFEKVVDYFAKWTERCDFSDICSNDLARSHEEL